MNQSDLDTLRHSCSHIMAQAVKELWPEVKVAIGPAIQDGFYYDFEKKDPFSEEDLTKIEQHMWAIIKKDPELTQKFLTKEQAIAWFQGKNERYKLELIAALPDEKISIYQTGDGFIDLCKGPHIARAGQIKAFKLLSVAGSYWRGDEKNTPLQRIYGTCFPTQEELNQHLNFLEEAQKRDHRKIGVQLGLFNFYHETAGAGLVFYLPAGAMLKKIIEHYVLDQHIRRGYQLVSTPHILKGKLWDISGHSDYYRDNMYFMDVDNEPFAVKPMNCPGTILIYKSALRSYRDLPLKLFELGTVYRKEKAGVLHGLLRVRGFTQDDGHIFCQDTQIKEEVMSVIDFVFDILHDFGFHEVSIELSTRPENFIGKIENWDLATQALKDALTGKRLEYEIHEGEGAFYGPKIDIKLKDALKREWQCSTIQCDFALPERFDLTYVTEKGEAKRPIMIHRALLGSVERFIGTLIEHYGGAFPVWLAPTQVVIIPIREQHNAYAQTILDICQKEGLRVKLDTRNESLNKRIREGTIQKLPYLIIVGDKEQSTNTVALRRYGQGDQGCMAVEQFMARIKQEVANKQ